jgi:hypothetical protein
MRERKATRAEHEDARVCRIERVLPPKNASQAIPLDPLLDVARDSLQFREKRLSETEAHLNFPARSLQNTSVRREHIRFKTCHQATLDTNTTHTRVLAGGYSYDSTCS